jgi:hypothetical protein
MTDALWYATRATGVVALILLTITVALGTIAGPLRSGWAARAGTHPTLLGGHSNPTASGRGRWISFTGHAAVSGKPGSGHEVITIRASTTASYARQLTVVLAGTKDGGGIAMSAGSVRIAAASVPALTGPVTSLSGPHLTAALHRLNGETEQVRLSLVTHGRSVSGRMLLNTGTAKGETNDDD